MNIIRLLRVFLAVVGCMVLLAPPVAAIDSINTLQTPFYSPNATNCSYSSNLIGSDNLERTYIYLTGKGLPPVSAAGIMGSLMFESTGGTGIDPTAQQTPGAWHDLSDAYNHGVGIAQWDGPRRVKLIQYAESQGLSISDLENGNQQDLPVELNYLWQELTHSYTGTYAQMQKETDLRQAALDWLIGYEQPLAKGNPDAYYFPQRLAAAQKIFQLYGNSTGSSSGGTGPSNCGSQPTNGSCRVVYEPEYSQQQLAQIFGDPGTADSHPALNLETVKFLGFETQVSPLVAPCLQSVSSQIEAANINYTVTSFGCYRFDPDSPPANIGLLSYHTYGAACDINPGTNPFQTCPDCGGPYDMPQEYVTIFRNNGFTWGGSWTNVKDYMHFEWHGVIP